MMIDLPEHITLEGLSSLTGYPHGRLKRARYRLGINGTRTGRSLAFDPVDARQIIAEADRVAAFNEPITLLNFDVEV